MVSSHSKTTPVVSSSLIPRLLPTFLMVQYATKAGEEEAGNEDGEEPGQCPPHSWWVNELFPFFVCRFKSTFQHVNRSLCAIDLTDNTSDTTPLFYVDVFSSSNENISYNISFEAVESFSLQ